MDQSYENRSKLKLISTVVAVIVIAGIIVVADHLKSEQAEAGGVRQPSSTVAASNTATTASTADTSAPTASYTDGTYTATSDYYVPHGYENIKVTVTIKSGIITSSSIVNSEGDRDSAGYQQDFAAVYQHYVVGKSLNGLSLSRVSGASDTTQGFNDALQQIANQAKA